MFSTSNKGRNLNGDKFNPELLSEIVRERTLKHPELIPNNKTVVIHLRAGDIIDDSEYTVDEFIRFDNVTKNDYTHPLSWYNQTFIEMESLKIAFDHILIVTGFHFHHPQ